MSYRPDKAFSVTELTRQIKGSLEGEFSRIWVEGEISNLRIPSSGHIYFTLKDDSAQIAAVVFRSSASKLSFKLKDGIAVTAFGNVSVYEKQGQYQVNILQMLPKGLGALQLAFEELKQRLQLEGLFDVTKKKQIPTLPQCIALVTSPTGAAVRDFLNIIGRRFPNIHIIIYPVRVQGEGSATEIASAIDELNQLDASGKITLDVLIITRGGGSLEDLWSFNEEIVARALARSKIPTISAVGHEIDHTISDFVADVRAPTPSAAAELVVQAKNEIADQLQQFQKRLDKDLHYRIVEKRQLFLQLSASYVFRQPREVVRQYQQQVDDLGHRISRATIAAFRSKHQRYEIIHAKFKLLSPQSIINAWQRQLQSHRHMLFTIGPRYHQDIVNRLQASKMKLDLLSPRSTLQRGYSITKLMHNKRIIREMSDVRQGDKIATTILDGEFSSVVAFD